MYRAWVRMFKNTAANYDRNRWGAVDIYRPLMQ